MLNNNNHEEWIIGKTVSKPVTVIISFVYQLNSRKQSKMYMNGETVYDYFIVFSMVYFDAYKLTIEIKQVYLGM